VDKYSIQPYSLKGGYGEVAEQNLPALFIFSNFGHWGLFDIWDLIFEISTSQ
jgi:hypothetical protein